VIGLVDKALAWDPRNRFDSAASMRAEILRIMDALGGAPVKKAEAAPARRGAVAPELQPEDLVEEEPEEEEDAEANDPAVLRLVDMFRRIERLLPTVRQYGWEHPETDNKLRNAFQGASRRWETACPLVAKPSVPAPRADHREPGHLRRRSPNLSLRACADQARPASPRRSCAP
jgi:hypothetical protein